MHTVKRLALGASLIALSARYTRHVVAKQAAALAPGDWYVLHEHTNVTVVVADPRLADAMGVRQAAPGARAHGGPRPRAVPQRSSAPHMVVTSGPLAGLIDEAFAAGLFDD